MVRRDARADQAERRREQVDQVDLEALAEQLIGRVEARRAGADDGDPAACRPRSPCPQLRKRSPRDARVPAAGACRHERAEPDRSDRPRRHGRQPRSQHRAPRLFDRRPQPQPAEDARLRRGVRPRGRDHRDGVGRGVRRRARPAAQDHHHGQGRRPGRRGDRRARAATSTRATSSSTPATRTSSTRSAARGACAERGLRFLGTGVSGGEEGALNGPSIMPGGDREAWDEVEEILTAIAVDVDGTPCCVYVGPDGAGHYVKMVHNGIEYADMQLIAESYDLLRHGAGLDVEGDRDGLRRLEPRRPRVVPDRDHREGARAQDDEATGEPLVDVILDQAEQKGTGRWTSQDALELGVPLTAITEAVFARSLSSLRDQRVAAADDPRRPEARRGTTQDESIVDDIRAALYASKVVAYAQGFEQMQAASREVRLGPRPRRDGDDLARRLHHPRALPQPHPRRLRGRARSSTCSPCRTSREAMAQAQDAWRRVIAKRGRARHPGAGVLLLPRLLRRLPPRARARVADPGPARLLRRAHLQARRPRGRRSTCAGRRTGARSPPSPAPARRRRARRCRAPVRRPARSRRPRGRSGRRDRAPAHA